jgi:hypothetical protein
VAWFLVFFTASTVLLDDWLAETFFAWLPDAILAFSTFEDGGVEPSRLVVIGSLVVALRLQRRRRPGHRGAVLPRPPAAPHRAARPLGPGAQHRAVLALPPVDAVAEPRPHRRVPADRLGGAAQAQRAGRDRGARDTSSSGCSPPPTTVVVGHGGHDRTGSAHSERTNPADRTEPR